MSDEAWLIGREMDASKKISWATEILVFDFELFIGGRCEKGSVTFEDRGSRQLHKLSALRQCRTSLFFIAVGQFPVRWVRRRSHLRDGRSIRSSSQTDYADRSDESQMLLCRSYGNAIL